MSYSIRIEDASTEAPIVMAAGSLKLITAAAREGLAAIKDKDGEFSAVVTETESVGGEDKRTVTRVSGDADVVAVVVKKKLTKERAENAPAEDAGDPDVTVE